MATGMSADDIKKHLAALQSKLNPVGPPIVEAHAEQPKKKPAKVKEALPTPEQVIAAAGPPPFEPAVLASGPCLTKDFKTLLLHLNPSYLGNSDGNQMLMEVVGAVPTCP